VCTRTGLDGRKITSPPDSDPRTVYPLPGPPIYMYMTLENASEGYECPVCHEFQDQSYTGCPRGNVPDFGRVSLMLKYTDITQNTYVQS